MGSTLTLTPPLVTTVGEMDGALAVLEECLLEEWSASVKRSS
jgi:hypothetical protein